MQKLKKQRADREGKMERKQPLAYETGGGRYSAHKITRRIKVLFIALVLCAGLVPFGGFTQQAEAAVTTAAVPDTPGVSTGFDQGKYKTIFSNILTRYQSLENSALVANPDLLSEWIIMNVAATGDTSSFDKEIVNTLALKAYQNPMTPGNTLNVQKAIIMANAYGLDASQISTSEGSIDLIECLFEESASSMNDFYGKAFTILALKGGTYSIPASSSVTLESLAQDIIGAQESDGGFAPFGGSKDTDSTAMAICALAAVRELPSVSESLTAATTALLGYRQADGGFADTAGEWNNFEPQTNANSTAVAVIALCSVGVNPAADWSELEFLSLTTQVDKFTPLADSGVSPMSALLSLSSSDLSSFPGWDVGMATEQAFRALAAYQGFVNTGGAYNIYTQAKEGVAGLRVSSDNVANSSDNVANSSDNGGKALAIPATDDSSDILIGTVALMTFCALGVLTYARKRKTT